MFMLKFSDKMYEVNFQTLMYFNVLLNISVLTIILSNKNRLLEELIYQPTETIFFFTYLAQKKCMLSFMCSVLPKMIY